MNGDIMVICLGTCNRMCFPYVRSIFVSDYVVYGYEFSLPNHIHIRICIRDWRANTDMVNAIPDPYPIHLYRWMEHTRKMSLGGSKRNLMGGFMEDEMLEIGVLYGSSRWNHYTHNGLFSQTN